MWFKNLKIFTLTSPITTNLEEFQSALEEFKFQPLNAMESVKTGFTHPLHPSIKNYAHNINGVFHFAIKTQEKVLPSAVVNDFLKERSDTKSDELGRPLSRKEKQVMKEEIVAELLPRAFSRSKVTNGYYDSNLNKIIINTSSSSKAEDILALLRKALGSLPALPWLDNHKLNTRLQQWLQALELPTDFHLGASVELKAPDEEGAKARFKNHLLSADEVQSHLQDKLVTDIELHRSDLLTFTINEFGCLKSLVYFDGLLSENEELGWEDLQARMESDLHLMCNAIEKVTSEIEKNISEL